MGELFVSCKDISKMSQVGFDWYRTDRISYMLDF